MREDASAWEFAFHARPQATEEMVADGSLAAREELFSVADLFDGAMIILAGPVFLSRVVGELAAADLREPPAPALCACAKRKSVSGSSGHLAVDGLLRVRMVNETKIAGIYSPSTVTVRNSCPP